MKNKIIFLLSIVVVLLIVCLSFGEVVHDYMPNYIDYFKIEKYCPGKNEICQSFQTEEDVKQYLKEKDPRKKFDVISLASYVVETSQNFGLLVFLLPFLVIANVILKIHDEISSGYIKNKLNRMSYKDVMKEYFLVALKSSLLVVFAYLFIFLISCIITGFNFHVVKNMQLDPKNQTFKYQHFIIYSTMLIVLQYLLFFGYSLIGIIMSFVSKNKIISVVLGYVYFVILCIGYLLFGAVVIRDTFGFQYGISNPFNLIGNYWFLDDLTNPIASVAVVISIILLNCLVIFKFIGTKERGILQYEKHNT